MIISLQHFMLPGTVVDWNVLKTKPSLFQPVRTPLPSCYGELWHRGRWELTLARQSVVQAIYAKCCSRYGRLLDDRASSWALATGVWHHPIGIRPTDCSLLVHERMAESKTCFAATHQLMKYDSRLFLRISQNRYLSCGLNRATVLLSDSVAESFCCIEDASNEE
ncbi:unnamed protein product [Protopolystoma xenopodis]|uniref:Uncharacterized protein n=1 Tax=Protopolystoma xenopodis TaxID=117903 RepID=A0A448XM51_9PLAT|nr:unnamed protein product [Protopolystoma xenopodis]